jgi:hypothetical protein
MLLDERHIQFMEQLMHYAILHEKNEISQHAELSSIRDLLKGRVLNKHYFEALNKYLDQPVLKPLGSFGLAYPSMNRADVFLYVLCDLPLTDMQWQQAIRYWYALHPSYLIIDDIRDYSKDKENGEENIVIDFGDGTGGFEKTFAMLQKNGEIMKEINPLLAQFLMEYEEELRDFVPVNS